MALIVLDRWAPARKGEVFLLTIGDQLLIEELRAAIGVNAQQGKREERAGLLERGQHRVGALLQQRDALGPAGGEIGQRQGVEKPPIEMVPTMGHQIHFHKARAILLPLREQVRTGIWDLPQGPGVVVDRPCRRGLRCVRKKRSAVETLMASNWRRSSSVSCRCPCCSSNATSLGSDGRSRLAHT